MHVGGSRVGGLGDRPAVAGADFAAWVAGRVDLQGPAVAGKPGACFVVLHPFLRAGYGGSHQPASGSISRCWAAGRVCCIGTAHGSVWPDISAEVSCWIRPHSWGEVQP